jgi:DNA replication protein DnaC
LQTLVNAELEDRYHKRIKKLIQKSRLPRIKHLKDFNASRIPELTQGLVNELATGNFLDRAENLLIFGNSGTGKTHLVIALVQEWCNRGRKAIFMTAAELIQELLKAKRQERWNEYIRSINRNEAIVIDDISYVACDKHETDLLFLLLASRYENKSLVITSNLPFGEWGTIFKDETTTKAAVDRLVHHSTVLRLNAESYRKESAQKKQEALQQEISSSK